MQFLQIPVLPVRALTLHLLTLVKLSEKGQEKILSTRSDTFCLLGALLSVISADFVQEYIKVAQF